jgi:hypothetical protein
VEHNISTLMKEMVANVDYSVQTYLSNHPEVEFYVVSDADISLRGCRHDMLLFMAAVMMACPSLNQVGTSLRIDNIPKHYEMRQKTFKWELQYWNFEKQFAAEWDYGGAGRPVFVHLIPAAIDTTFSMHRSKVAFRNLKIPSLRMGAPYMAEHIPWYSSRPSPDEVWYKQHGAKHFSNYILNPASEVPLFETYEDLCPQGMKDPLVSKVILAKNGMQKTLCEATSARPLVHSMLHVLRNISQRSRCVVFDVGPNAGGFFGLAGMAYGCDASFIGIPNSCYNDVAGAVETNMFTGKGIVSVQDPPVIKDAKKKTKSKKKSKKSSKSKGCNCVAHDIDLSAHIIMNHTHNHLRKRSSTHSSRDFNILIIEISEYGYKALRSSLPLFQRHRLHNVFLDVTSNCASGAEKLIVNKTQVSGIFRKIASFGYSMWALAESRKTDRQDSFLLNTMDDIESFVASDNFLRHSMLFFLPGTPSESLVTWVPTNMDVGFK